jgi:hypothetical protein
MPCSASGTLASSVQAFTGLWPAQGQWSLMAADGPAGLVSRRRALVVA